MSNSECDFMLERFELRRTGLKHKKINKKYFYSDFIFCEKACYACYRRGDLSKKGPLRFELVLRGKRINRKKLNVKTLSRPRIKRTYQSSNSNMCHLDMAAGQRHGVKLSNSKIANYNSSRMSARLKVPAKNSPALLFISRGKEEERKTTTISCFSPA